MPSGRVDDSLSLTQVGHAQYILHVKQNIYLGIQILGGQLLLPILVLTILISKAVKRHPVFISFCISLILSSIIYSSLLYSGHSDISHRKCFIQASLINGAEVLTACTNLALATHLWMLLWRCSTSGGQDKSLTCISRVEDVYACALLVVPFLVFIAFTATAMIIGDRPFRPQEGTDIPGYEFSYHGTFYCILLPSVNFANFQLRQSAVAFNCCISAITVGFEVFTVVLVLRNRNFLKTMDLNWGALCLRIALFTAYRIVIFSLNMVVIPNPDQDQLLPTGVIADSNLFNGIVEYFNAATPLMAFGIFAFEKDIRYAWRFWRSGNSGAGDKLALACPESI